MFSRKYNSSANSSQSRPKQNLSQFGLFDLPNIDNFKDDDDEGIDDDDDDLEAELLALTNGLASKPKPKCPPRLPVDSSELDRMVKASLQDIPSDEDVSSGEDDPGILAELEDLQVGFKISDVEVEQNATSPQGNSSLKLVIEERLKMYEIAEMNAKDSNDAVKARRINRGITSLKSLLKQVNGGHAINEEDIPPVVSVTAQKLLPSVTVPKSSEGSTKDPSAVLEAPPIPSRTIKHNASSVDGSKDEPQPKMKPPQCEPPKTPDKSSHGDLEILRERQTEYKKAALEAKKRNDIPTALNYVKIVKQFDLMIQAISEGSLVDLSSIPPTLSAVNASSFIDTSSLPMKSEESVQGSNDPVSFQSTPAATPSSNAAPTEAYVSPKTVMEALNQRLLIFRQSKETAEREDNAGKVRRMGRIVKQYEDAIRLHKAGKPIPVDDLPTPPGFAPIPVDGPAKVEPEPAATTTPIEVPKPAPKTVPSPDVVPIPPARRSTGTITRSEKQSQTLLMKQKLFKVAALKAKQGGNLELAKEYLKLAKGFEPLIEASKCGLPVDLATVPVPPNDKGILESSEDVIRLNDTIEGTNLDVYRKLLSDLQQQLEMCVKTRDHFKAMGDVANANRFEQLAVQTKKDFKFVQLAFQSNLRVPQFHYETKSFAIVQCNTDLTDNDVEVNIIQGINFNVDNPRSVDTFVKVIFPYPAETPQQYKTAVTYDTNNPVYNATTTFNIQRNNRACKRIFLRNALKCEVWSRGGLFRSDALLGTVTVKLQPLETKCTLHDAYDLMDGRRIIGGKLEVKLRLRDPMTQKQIEQVQEKWLIIDT